jgi:hypothetical protein
MVTLLSSDKSSTLLCETHDKHEEEAVLEDGF